MGKTSIEWTDFSINPIRARLKSTGAVGHYCEKIASGCAHCYSSNFQKRFGLPPFGAGQHRDDVEIFLDESKLDEVRRRKKPTKWFWCDMTDFFGDWMESDWLRKCFEAMDATPQHTHMLLTKRPENIRKMWARTGMSRIGDQPAVELKGIRRNVWLGTSVAHQPDADKNIPELLKCRDMSPVLFASYEPAIGPVDFTRIKLPGGYELNALKGEIRGTITRDIRPSPSLDWLICGGESGHNARPFRMNWASETVYQCHKFEVSVFVKQMGSNAHTAQGAHIIFRDSKGGNDDEWPGKIRVREFPVPERTTV